MFPCEALPVSRWRRGAPSLVAALLVLVASAAEASRTLRVGLAAPLETLDIHRARDLASVKVLGNVAETLVATAAGSSRLEPGLALSWEPADRFRLWTFRIRAGVVFSDGTPLTPSRVAESFRTVESITSRATIAADDAKGTVLFRLAEPDAEFPYQLAPGFAAVLLRQGGKILGTGPFVLDPSTTPQKVLLLRNERYRGPAPKVDRVAFRVYGSDGASFEPLRRALTSDAIDLTDSLPPWELDELTGVGTVATGSVTSRGLTMLAMNGSKKPLSEPRVRRAIAHALDRAALVAAFFPPGTPVARAPLPPTIQPAASDPWTFDPSRARQLLADAGYPKGFDLTILDAGSAGAQKSDAARMADLVIRDLAAVGIRVKLVLSKSPGDFLDRLSGGEFELAVSRWIADNGSAADFLWSNLSSAAIGRCSTCNNVWRWKNEEADRMLAEYRATRRPGAFTRVVEIFGLEAPFVPLAYGPEVAAWNRRVKGFAASAAPVLPLHRVELAGVLPEPDAQPSGGARMGTGR